MDSKKKIVEAFYILVAEKGYAKASMNDVVKEVNLSKGAIYHHFESKEKLFLEVLKFVFCKDQILIVNMDNIKGEDFREKLIKLGKNYLNLNKIDKHYFKFRNELIVLSLRDEKFRSYLVEAFDEYVKSFEDLLIKLKDEGIITRDINIQAKGAQLFMLLDTMILYQSFNVNISFEDVWIDFVNEIFN